MLVSLYAPVSLVNAVFIASSDQDGVVLLCRSESRDLLVGEMVLRCSYSQIIFNALRIARHV